MDGVELTPLKKIYNPKGIILHALKKSDNGFVDFGEAYFSTITQNEIKGWKKHTLMTLNLIVPIGEIEFAVYNEIEDNFFNIQLSQSNYKRLTISPGLWVSFRGIKSENILLNIASIEHDSQESVDMEIDKLPFNWGSNDDQK